MTKLPIFSSRDVSILDIAPAPEPKAPTIRDLLKFLFPPTEDTTAVRMKLFDGDLVTVHIEICDRVMSGQMYSAKVGCKYWGTPLTEMFYVMVTKVERRKDGSILLIHAEEVSEEDFVHNTPPSLPSLRIELEVE